MKLNLAYIKDRTKRKMEICRKKYRQYKRSYTKLFILYIELSTNFLLSCLVSLLLFHKEIPFTLY